MGERKGRPVPVEDDGVIDSYHGVIPAQHALRRACCVSQNSRTFMSVCNHFVWGCHSSQVGLPLEPR